jgi:hypothetical protein
LPRKRNTYLLLDLNVMLPFQNKGDSLHNLLSMSAHYFVDMLKNKEKFIIVIWKTKKRTI